jgi:hypothetical protein
MQHPFLLCLFLYFFCSKFSSYQFILSVALEAKYEIMSLSAHRFYFQTGQEALLSCNIILEKYGSDVCNIGDHGGLLQIF